VSYDVSLDTWSDSPRGRIMVIGRSKGGNRNDLELWKEVNFDDKFTTKEWVCGDSIFRGLNKETSDIRSKLNIVTPVNNPKLDKQKELSQRISCLRLGIENVFALLKKNRILVDKWRKSLEEHHKVWVYLAFNHNRRVSNGLEIRNEEFLYYI